MIIIDYVGQSYNLLIINDITNKNNIKGIINVSLNDSYLSLR